MLIDGRIIADWHVVCRRADGTERVMRTFDSREDAERLAAGMCRSFLPARVAGLDEWCWNTQILPRDPRPLWGR